MSRRVSAEDFLKTAEAPVAVGFPSPAEEFRERQLDLNQKLVRHPAATFFFRMAGKTMQGAGIHDQDILVVDTSLTPQAGHVVMAVVNGQFVVRRLIQHHHHEAFAAESPNTLNIVSPSPDQFVVWGVVTYVIHSLFP